MNLLELFDKSTEIILEKKCTSYLHDLLKSYEMNDWEQYIISDFEIINNKNYYKNLIYQNDIIELYIITWKENSCSPIHDHPENGCILKILKGQLFEEVFKNINGNIKYLNKTYLNNKFLNVNNIGFKKGNKYPHRITNIFNDISVSLHIYSKPNYKHNIYLIE